GLRLLLGGGLLRGFGGAALGRREALTPLGDELRTGSVGADERLELGLEAGSSGGVLARDVGEQSPCAVEQADAFGEWDVLVFERLVDGEHGLHALRGSPAGPAVER